MIRISDIRIDGGTQSRTEINEQTVAEYAEAMADPNTVFPPVVVYFDGQDYWLADGFHRIAAWQRIGREEIPADIRDGDRRMAILHSVASNSAHGLRRTNADKRHAVTILLEDPEWGCWSDREIARQCAVDHKTVAKVRADLTEDFPSDNARTYITKHGTEARMNTANIGGSGQVSEDAPEAEADADDASFEAFYEAVKENDREVAAKEAASGDDPFLAALDEAEQETDATETDNSTDNPADTSAADIEKYAPQTDILQPEEADSRPDMPDADTGPPTDDCQTEEPVSEAEVKLRKELRKLTPDAIEDDWISLKLQVAEQRKKIGDQRFEIQELNARLKEFEDLEGGRALGNAQRQRDTARFRMKEHQANAARLQRRVNFMKKEIKDLKKQIGVREEGDAAPDAA